MLRLNSLSASGMRYGSLRKKRLACSRVSQPLEMAACAASCALVTRSAIICFPFVWGKGLRTGFVRGFYRSWCVGWCKVSGGGCGVWLVGESWVWLLWEVEEFFLFVFAGAGFLGGFVGVALVAKYAEVF